MMCTRLMLGLVLCVGLVGCRDGAAPDGEPPAAAPVPRGAPVAAASEGVTPTAHAPDALLTGPPGSWPATLDAIVIGGGAFPEANQVQMEQDVVLAREAFGAATGVLFGSGPRGAAVQVLDEVARGDGLRARLGRLLAPRGGRDASYRATRTAPVAAATRDNVVAVLEAALAQDGPPVTVFVATHGLPGVEAADNAIELWGGGQLTVRDVDVLTAREGARRGSRWVMASCFSGGFAELAFRGAEVGHGAAAGRCGLFATTWDLEASGCDANPERAEQEGYALHMLHALRGLDRDGQPVALEVLDLDGDGAIGLLEAHTRARIAGQGIDVPTTTSERWLRAVASPTGASVAVELPEERAVIEALSATTGLADARDARARLWALDDALAAMFETEAQHIAEEELAYGALAAELLARWPVLDDPWHPDFEPGADRLNAQRESPVIMPPC